MTNLIHRILTSAAFLLSALLIPPAAQAGPVAPTQALDDKAASALLDPVESCCSCRGFGEFCDFYKNMGVLYDNPENPWIQRVHATARFQWQ